MNEQSNTPFLEFLWVTLCISAPIFLATLTIAVLVLKIRGFSWLHIAGLLPVLLLANALITIAAWVVVASLEMKAKYSYLMIFAPSLIAAVITTVSLCLIRRKEAPIPLSRNEA